MTRRPRMPHTPQKTQGGFTMIEIMVVLLIVAILACVAYPGYQHAIVNTKRAEGKSALMKAMQQQERYFSSHMRYLAFSADSTDTNAKRFTWFSGPTAAASAYEISAQACDDDISDCVILFARPGTVRVDAGFHDPVCGVLSLNSAGETSADAAQCW